MATLAGPFDLALASYSLYNVEMIAAVIRDLVRLSQHVVALMGTGQRREWYRALYRRFWGRDPVPPPQVQYFYPLLLEMGIYADVEVFWTSYNYVCDSEEALVRVCLHLPWLRKIRRLGGERKAILHRIRRIEIFYGQLH